ncbi:MAG: hypothetical protein JNM40_24490 [Myxococcales bacterium]|nr:hypothetical protein [Myxococcales bacterium]
MRSTWLGLGLGLFTFIGCNALWQGYLSPLDDPSDGSIADLSDVDLTGEPPPDLTGQPPVDMAMSKLCGFAPGLSGVSKYNVYAQLFTFTGYTPTRLAVADIDNDGMADIAASDLSTTIKIWYGQPSSVACTYSSSSNCMITGTTGTPSIFDIAGFTINPTTGPGAFLVARSNSTTNAAGSCSQRTPVFKPYNNASFSSSSSRKELYVPRPKVVTNGVFAIFEKGTDGTGDRVNSVKLNATLDLESVVTVVSHGNLPGTPQPEPRNATGIRVDTNNYDGILDVAAFEVGATNAGRLRIYRNNHIDSPPASPFSVNISPASSSDLFADLNRMISGKLSSDANDDVVAIGLTPPQLIPFIVSNTGSISQLAPFSLPITAGMATRNNIILADTNEDTTDELILPNGQNVSIYTFTGTTFTNPQNLSVPVGNTIDAISIGYVETNFSSKSVDIFVLSHKGSQYEVGVFRYQQ